MKGKMLFFLFSSVILSARLLGQDTLPKFSVKAPGNNRIIVSWVNTYGLVKQIGIQRSYDSLKNYKTILTVADPMTRENGYADTKAPGEPMFYRLFVLLDKGVFYFTEAKKPVADTIRKMDLGKVDKLRPVDSLNYPNSSNLNGKNKPDVFIPSIYIYTQQNGYIRVNLPEAGEKKYSIKFFEEEGDPVFELKDIKDPYFTIDRTNFYHAGWFRFEVYKDGKLVEKHKLYLPKDF